MLDILMREIFTLYNRMKVLHLTQFVQSRRSKVSVPTIFCWTHPSHVYYRLHSTR